jgi:hypothetical protein
MRGAAARSSSSAWRNSVRKKAASRSSKRYRSRKIRVSWNVLLAAKVLKDWRKRWACSPSRNCSMA